MQPRMARHRCLENPPDGQGIDSDICAQTDYMFGGMKDTLTNFQLEVEKGINDVLGQACFLCRCCRQLNAEKRAQYVALLDGNFRHIAPRQGGDDWRKR